MNEVLKVPEDVKQRAAELEGPFSLEQKAVESVAARRALGITVEHFSHHDVPNEKRLEARNKRLKNLSAGKSKLSIP